MTRLLLWASLFFIASNQLNAMRLVVNKPSHRIFAARGFHTSLRCAGHSDFRKIPPGTKSPMPCVFGDVPRNFKTNNSILIDTLIKSEFEEAATTVKYLTDPNEATGIKSILTLLELALTQGDFNTANKLVEQGADINAQALLSNGKKLLLVHKMAYYPQALEFLLEKGVDINLEPAYPILDYIFTDFELLRIYMAPENSLSLDLLYSKYKQRNLHSHQLKDSTTELHLLQMGWDDWTRLDLNNHDLTKEEKIFILFWQALRIDDANELKKLIETHGINIHKKMPFMNDLPLNEAIKRGRKKAVKLFLDLGAHPAKDKYESALKILSDYRKAQYFGAAK